MEICNLSEPQISFLYIFEASLPEFSFQIGIFQINHLSNLYVSRKPPPASRPRWDPNTRMGPLWSVECVHAIESPIVRL